MIEKQNNKKKKKKMKGKKKEEMDILERTLGLAQTVDKKYV